MDIERIRTRLHEIASSPKNVRFSELEALLDNHIGLMFANYNHRDNGAHHAFTVGPQYGAQTFNIAEPHGGGFVKARYVRAFLDAMEELGVYVPEEENR
jgi:hypothetical protein